MVNSDDLSKLYEAVSTKFDIGSFDDFTSKMETEDMRKSFYDTVAGKGLDLGSYEDYESRLKKKDDSVVSSILPQTDSEDTPLQSELSQPSLEETSQNSLEERFSGYSDMPEADQFIMRQQEESRQFFEVNGLDLDEKVDFDSRRKALEESNKKEEETEEDLGFLGNLHKMITSTEDLEDDMFTTEEDAVNTYFSENADKIFEAEKQYTQAKVEQIKSTFPPEQRLEQFQAEGIDLGYVPIKNLKINGEEVSVKEFEKNLYDQNFIDQVQAGEIDIEVLDTQGNEVLENLNKLLNRQIESGGQWGDVAQSFYAGGLDMLIAGPLELLEGVGAQSSPYQQTMFKIKGGFLANKVHDYANSQRDKTRLYAEDSMSESLLDGNWGDAFFQTGNAIAESAPLILSMYAAAPLGLAEGATLGLAGVSSGGLKDIELRDQRLKGEIDISEGMLLANDVLTGGAEMFFEKFTLDAVNASRGVFKMAKINPSEIAEGIVKGLYKNAPVEGLSELATELSNSLTDLITRDIDYEKGELKDTAVSIEEVAVRMSDSFLVGTIMGAGMTTTPYLSQTLKSFNIIDKNISTVFTMEDGSIKEMSRAEGLRFVKDPEVADQIRRSTIKMDVSMNDIARQELENIVYGYSAPDAVASREVMRGKETVVQDLSTKIAESEEVSTEEINNLSKAITEMEAEGKVSKYNESETTVATRKKVQAILKEKGIEITNATQTQDVSTSKVTNTTEVNKINTEEEYRSVKKQVKDKRIPKVIISETQTGVTVKGKVVQESEVTQGQFKNIAAAKNAIKEYKAKVKAAKEGMMVENDLFPANNKLFIKTNKETLDEVPQEVLDSKEYYVLTSEKEGLTVEERDARMVELKSMLDKAGAKYYTVQGVYNGVAEESLVVTGLNEGQALTIGRQFGQDSIFSAEKGLMFSSGAVAPLNGDAVEGIDARKRDALTIMNVGGKKVSLHTGIDWKKMSYGKNFNSDNIHRLDDSDPNYDKELFEGVTEDRKKALGFAFKLLNSIGGLNVTVVRNSAAMAQQLKALGQDPANSRGSFFRGADKTIYVNLETVQGNTLFHEIIHPMVDFIKVNDAALYSRIEQEVTDSNVKRRTTLKGKKMKGSYLEWAEVNYANLSREGQIEEAFAEMMGDAAYGHFKNRQSKLNRVLDVITAILKKLNIDVTKENIASINLDDMSLADMSTNLADALLDGRKITVGGVEFEVGDMPGEVEPKFQLDAVDRRTGIQYTYDKNSKVFAEMEADGRITSGKNIQDFKGKTMMFHAPDAMFSGSIIDADGTILVEGKGGVMYPFVFNEEGYFWASTDNAAEKMAEQLNSMMDENDGKIYMALTTATQDKLLSSTAASRGILNLFSSENFIKKIGMNKSQLYKSVIEAANNVSTVTKIKIDKKTGEEVKSTKKVGLDLKLKAYRASSNFTSDVVEKIWSKLDNSTSSFDDRKNFSDRLLTNIRKFKVLESGSSKVNFVNFINTTDPSLDYSKFNKDGSGNINSLKKAIINVLTEPSLREKDGDTNRIYAVLEMDGPVKPINTKENPNVPDYESYGTAIVSESKNRTTIHRLDNRDFWYDVTEEPGTNAIIGGRERLSSADKMSSIASQIMPATAGVSTTPLKISNDIRFQTPQVEESAIKEHVKNSVIKTPMFHGTETAFDEFAEDKKDLKFRGKGAAKVAAEGRYKVTFFSKGTELASQYANQNPENPSPGARLVESYLDIRKPFDITDRSTWDALIKAGSLSRVLSINEAVGMNHFELDNATDTYEGIQILMKMLSKKDRAAVQYKLDNTGAVPIIGGDAIHSEVTRLRLELLKAQGELAVRGGMEFKDKDGNSYSYEAGGAGNNWSALEDIIEDGTYLFTGSFGNSRKPFKGLRSLGYDAVINVESGFTNVGVFNTSQIKVSNDNINPQKPGLRFQTPSYDMEYTPNALVSLNMQDIEKANPTEWVSRISKGVKGSARDVDTMGLLEVLTAYQKEAKVKSIPKEVVAQLIATNMAEIETKILENDPVINYDDYFVDYDGSTYGVTTPEGLVLNSGVEVTEYVEDLSNDEINNIIDEGLDGMSPGARYSEVTLPGGKNYREFLIRDKSSEEIFTAPHYDEFGENLIASVRADDRVGPNGEKILFVQEIQSDWAQQGSKAGFKKEGEADSRLTQEQGLRYGRLLRYMDERSLTSDERMEFSNLERIDDLQEVARKKVPNLPWNQTDLWVGLAIRKIINQASKEGYDQVAFVNGEQSDIIQSHTGSNAGKTHEFYNNIVPKNINNELKRLVKGMKYSVVESKENEVTSPFITHMMNNPDIEGNVMSLEEAETQEGYKASISNKNAVINLTPELKAATDKVGPLRFQKPLEEPLSDFQKRFALDLNLLTKDLQELDDNFTIDYNATNFGLNPRNRRTVLFDIEQVNLSASKAFSEIKDNYPELNKEKPLIDDPYSSENYSLISKGVGSQGGVFLDNRDNSILKLTKSPYEVIGSLKVMSAQKSKAKFKIHFPEIYSIQKVNSENNFYAIKRENVEPFNEGKLSEVKDVFSVIKNYYPNYGGGIEFGELLTKEDVYLPIMDNIRFQAPKEEGETNDYTDGAFTIGWDISKLLQDTDYAAGTYLSGLIDQRSFKSKDRQRYDIRLTTLLAKPFGTHSDKEVKEIMARSRGSLNAELLEANLIKRRLEKANKEANLSPEEINDLLHNLDDVKAMEDSDIKMALLEMRAQVDRLSSTLISEGLIDGQTMFSVDANLGFYITKSYKNFEVKGWKQTDNLIIKKAKDFLYKEAKKDNPKASEDKLLNIVDESFRKLTEDKEFSYNMKGNGSLDGLTRVTSIFKQKKVIPQEIKDLWGEIDSPLFNYNNTVKKLAQTVSAERMYRDILEIGDGKFISDTYNRNSTTNELKGAKWGALDGKFVDNEMFSVMNQMNPEGGEGSFRWAYDFYMNMVLFNKKMKTVWNPGTHVKNLVGNTAFATMNGHLNPLSPKMYKDGWTSMKTVSGMKTIELQELYKKLTAKGVVSSSASLEEIRGIAKDLAQSDFDLSEYLDEKNGKVQKLAAKAKRAVGKPYKYLDGKFSKAYQAEDDVWKIFGYLSEKARYVKAGLTEKEADDMAARNIINLYPNYAEIPRAIRVVGRSPLIGSFVAFQAESFRNSKNVVMLGFQEIGSSNPKIRKIGATRIAGTIATMALLEGLQLYTLQFLSEALGLSGGDEEESEQRKIRTLVADWDKSGSLGYVDSGSLDTKTNEEQMENDKYFDYINFSSISGVGYIKDIMRLAFEDIETQAGKESSFRVMEQVFAPFIGEEMTLSAMQEAYTNQGGKVYNRTDDSLTKLSKMVMFVGGKIKPGVVSSGIRVYNSMDEDSDRVPLYETMALFGLRINRGNANKSLAINARAAYNDMRERADDGILRSKSLLQKELLVNPDLDNDLSIISDLMAAARLNKVAGEDTRTILKGMGVSSIVIDLAYNRMIKNYMQDVLSVDAK